MINTWNFEIYILLDTEGINNFLEKRQLETENDEYSQELIQEMSKKISNRIESYKAGLRRFYIVNDYPKKLN